MSNHSNDKQEQGAICHHYTYHKVHTFYIGSFEEYLLMEAFIGIFPNVKLILNRRLRDGVLDRMIAEYKGGEPTKPKRDYKEYYDRMKKKDIYMC